MPFPAGFSAALMFRSEICLTEFETCESERCFNQTTEVSRRETFDLDLLFCETSFVG